MAKMSIRLDTYLKHVQVNHNLCCKFDWKGWKVYYKSPKRGSPAKTVRGAGAFSGKRCTTNDQRMQYMDNVVLVLDTIDREIGRTPASINLRKIFTSSIAKLKKEDSGD